jgi:hypothetical protein
LICAVLPLAFGVTGCMGIGEAGSHEVVAGNWPAAKADFSADYASHPEHPIAVFNIGATYHHDGDIAKADSMFSEAVQRGKGYVPDGTLEPAGLTVADHACARLHRDNRLDANCGDRIAMETTAPPQVAQAEPPAAEAQATEVAPPRKQDRN